MADGVQIVAFVGGELRALAPELVPGEAVLALPLSRLVSKMVHVPAGEDAVAVATPVLAAMSPFPDEPLTVSCETVRETEAERVVLAAALPESAAEDIAAALDTARINVTRVDALALGELRGLWPQLGVDQSDARRLLLLKGADCISVFVLDGEVPSAVRAIVSEDDIRRDIMLSLLEAEEFGGAHPLAEIVVSGDVDVTGLETFAPVRRLETAVEPLVRALEGVASRAVEASSLDVLPASWREVLEETRFKAKLKKGMAIAGGIWALIMVVLFGVPVVYGLLADRQKSLCKEHARQFKEVSVMKEKVNLVRKYSDHTRGALEIMKAVSDILPLPEGEETSCIELKDWNFKRQDGLRFSGKADSKELVYKFKDALEGLRNDGVFTQVDFKGPEAERGGGARFTIDCSFKEGEDES